MSILSFSQPSESAYSELEPLTPWPAVARSGGRAWRLGRGLVRFFMLALLESRMRSAARELQRLDDRMLRDIGVARSEIEHVVRYGRAGQLAPFAADWKRWSAGWPADRTPA